MITRSPINHRSAVALAIGVVAMTGVALTGCGSQGGPAAAAGSEAPASTAAPASPVAVAALDNVFEAATVNVKVGQPVVWTNGGGNQHNVVPVDGASWGVAAEAFPPGSGTYEHAFSAPGTYAYYCTIHGTKKGKGMYGTVVVEA